MLFGLGKFLIVCILFLVGCFLCLFMWCLRYVILFVKKIYFFFFSWIFVVFNFFNIFVRFCKCLLWVFLVISILFNWIIILDMFWSRFLIVFWNMLGVDEILKGRWLYWKSFLCVLIVVYFLDFLFNFNCW